MGNETLIFIVAHFSFNQCYNMNVFKFLHYPAMVFDIRIKKTHIKFTYNCKAVGTVG